MPFIGKPEMHAKNHRNAHRTYARAALMDGPNGMEPAVGVFQSGQLLSLLPLTQALRLSNEIVDATEDHKVTA